MRMVDKRSAILAGVTAVVIAVVAGCGDDSTGAADAAADSQIVPPGDGGDLDSGFVDGGPSDSGATDSGTPDGGAPDSGPVDPCPSPGEEPCAGSCVNTLTDADHCGRCGYGCGAGACVDGICVLATGLLNPIGIVVDATHVYWTNLGDEQNGYLDGSVMRIAKTGGAPEVLASGQHGPRGIDVDSTHVYWTNYLGGEIRRAELSGANPETLYTDNGYPYELAVDATQVYWTQWLGAGTRRAPKAGGVPIAIPGQNNSGGIDVNSGAAYWSRFSSGVVNSAPLGGPGLTQIAANQDFPFDIVVDDTLAAWSAHGTSRYSGSIMALSLGSMAVTTIATQENFPAGVTADATYVYWTRRGTPSLYNDSQIRRAPRSGAGPVELLADNQLMAQYLAVDETSVYWTATLAHAIFKTAKDNVLRRTEACTGQQVDAELTRQPVDVIIVIDNSGSMGQEIVGVQDNINLNFAELFEASGIDYRVILLAEHGAWNPDESVCIEAPLGGIPQGGCTPPPPQPIHNPPRFFHYSYAVFSHDSLCKVLDRFDKPDLYGHAPAGYQQWLRPEAFKVFLAVTDDGVSCSWNGQMYSDANSVLGGESAGNAFDAALLALAPDQFGAPGARNYRWHSLIALGNSPSGPSQPWLPTDPITITECPTAADPGTGYQQLSILTGGLRFPLCDPASYDVVFNAIAQEAITGATLTCEYRLPMAPPGETIDRSTVTVEYTPGGGGVPQALVQVAGAAQCGPDSFYLERDDVVLCPAICGTVQADAAATLRTIFDCEPAP